MARPSKKLRSFEGLESRAMLAGHVNTLVDGSGNLMITGNNAANIISVQQISPTSWEIDGFNTGINGRHKPVVIDNVTGSISINLGGGNDVLSLGNGTIEGNLSIVMGGGIDRATLQNLTIRDFLHYQGDAGNDTLRVTNVTVLDPTDAYFSSIDGANGNDRVFLDQFNDQNLTTNLGAGNDKMSVTDCLFASEGDSSRLSIDAGAGNDNVQINSITTDALNIDLGDGNRDVLGVQRTLAKSSSLEGGAGKHDRLTQSANLLGAIGGGSNFLDGFEKIK